MFRLLKSKPAQMKTQRRHRRHESKGAEVVIGEATYAMRDWSHGGVLVALRGVNLILGQKVMLTLRFPRGQETRQRGEVLRLENGHAAIGFAEEPGPATMRCLQQVADLEAAARLSN